MRLLGALVVAVLRWRNGRRHRRCLAHIERLERALYPKWFAPIGSGRKYVWEAESKDLVFAPGAVWVVDDPMKIAILHKHNLQRSMISRQVKTMNHVQIVPPFHQPTEGRPA